MDVWGFPLSFNPSKSLAQMSTQSTTFDHPWDTNHFPLDLLEEVKLVTMSHHPLVLSNLDILEAPLIPYFLRLEKMTSNAFSNVIPLHLLTELFPLLLVIKGFLLLGKGLFRRIKV